MPASNVAEYAIALQSAKGTPAAAPQYRFDVTGADLKPTPEMEVREETGLGRDEGDTYIRLLSVSGGAEVLARPKTMGLFAYGVLGAKAVTGTEDPYTHANTVANDQPWFTVWRSIGGYLHERFDDCKIVGMTLAGEPGGDLTCSLSIMGLAFTRLTSPIPAGGVYEQGQPFRVPGTVYDIDTVTNDAVTDFSISIEAGQVGLQTNGISYKFLEPTRRTISGTYTEVAQNIEMYAKSLYGGAAGTVAAEVPYEGSWEATFGDYADGPGLKIEIPRTIVTPIQIDPDSGGDPLMMPVEFKAGRPASGSILTISLLNDIATYPAAA